MTFGPEFSRFLKIPLKFSLSLVELTWESWATHGNSSGGLMKSDISTTRPLKLPVLFAYLCIALVGSSPLSAQGEQPSFAFKSQCPSTPQEIQKLNKCIECFNDSGDIKTCCPPNSRFQGAKGGCLLKQFHDWCTIAGYDARQCFEDVISTRPPLFRYEWPALRPIPQLPPALPQSGQLAGPQ